MKTVFYAAGVILLVFAAGCATPLVVDHDFDTTYDFTKLKSYDWLPSQQGTDREELAAKRWESAMNDQLKTKGFSRSAEAPDFLVSLEGVKKTVTAGSTAVGASISVPVGQHGSVSLGGGKSKPRVKQEGTLTVNIIDARTKAMVWQGSATGAVKEKSSPEEQQAVAGQVVAEVLKDFPPKKH